MVVDLTPTKCPEIDQKTRAEFHRATRPPAGDITKDGVRKWIDQLEMSERRKNLAGQRLADEFDRCRGTETATASASS